MRLAISTSYWPMAWPSKDDTAVTILTGSSSLQLPLWRDNQLDAELPEFEAPESSEPIKVTTLRQRSYPVTRIQDLGSGTQVIRMERDDGCYRIDDIDLTYEHKGLEVFHINADDPYSARLDSDWHVSYSRGDWNPRFRHKTRLSCDRDNFFLEDEIEAFEKDKPAFKRTWRYTIPRENV